MFKKFMLGMLVIALALSLGIQALAEKTTITYWSMVPASCPWDTEIVEEFEKQFPDIKVNRKYIPSGNMKEKVMTAIAGGETPDVLTDDVRRIAAWSYQGALESLNGKLSEEDLNDFIPSLLESLTIEGNLIGYPLPYGSRRWGVNKTIVEKAGVVDLLPTGENREWFFEDFMKVVEAIAELDEDVYPLGFFANGCSGDYYTLVNFQMFGANLYENGDHTKTTLNSEAGVEALEWMINMVDRGYAPKGVAAITDDDFVAMRASGKVAFGGWPFVAKQRQAHYDNKLIDYLAEDYYIEPPHIKGTPAPPLFTSLITICVFKGDKVDAALKFAEFYASKENTMKVVKASLQLSTRKSVPLFSESEAVKVPQYIALKNGIADSGITSPYYLEVRNLLYPELQAAFMGEKTPKEALDDFAEAVSALWK